MAWYNNRYRCPDCKAVWDSDWSSGCDEECPECEARNISPLWSENLSVVVEPQKDGSWTIWRSPPEADDKPRYKLVGVLEPKKSGAFKFVKNTQVE